MNGVSALTVLAITRSAEFGDRINALFAAMGDVRVDSRVGDLRSINGEAVVALERADVLLVDIDANDEEELRHLGQIVEQRREGTAILATAEDYMNACALLEAPLGESLGDKPSETQFDAAATLHSKFGEASFTTQDARPVLRVKTTRSAQRWLRALAESGLLELVEHERGKPSIWRALEIDRGTAATLPDVASVCRTVAEDLVN